jgi:hypothetical protein
MKRILFCAFCLLLAAGYLPAQPARNLVHEASLNANARYLAGLSPESDLKLPVQDPVWIKYSKSFNSAWNTLDKRRLAPTRAWTKVELAADWNSAKPVFYLFSGPDFVNVYQFFPDASLYVLGGLEPVGQIPDLASLPEKDVEPMLDSLRVSLNDVLSMGFFKTNDMAADLHRDDLGGVTPLLFLFLARCGLHIQEAEKVGLDTLGQVQAPGRGLIPGIKITFRKTARGDEAPLQTLYYFSANVSDEGYHQNPALFRFIAAQEQGLCYLKSASYLMHKVYFSQIRTLLMDKSQVIVQDDSGLPLHLFEATAWDLCFYGSYDEPIALFKDFLQPDLQEAYQKGKVKPLPFGTGYRHHEGRSNLMVAVRKK